MRHEKKLWCVATIAGYVLSATIVHAYTYDVGPNYVNMSGSRCRPETSALGDALTYGNGRVMVNSGTSTRRLFCPVQRRSADYYARDVAGAELRVNVSVLSIWAQDSNSSGRVSCFAFASGLGSGATWMTPTGFLCATQGGCSSVASSFQGMNGISIFNPFPNVTSVSWGIACDVSGNSMLLYSQSRVLANQ
jgi:hypothetical protein